MDLRLPATLDTGTFGEIAHVPLGIPELERDDIARNLVGVL
jgi:hypothetical protein